MPPPLPVKKRGGRGSISSPSSTPTHTPSRGPFPVTADMLIRSLDSMGLSQRSSAGAPLPPVPIRMESIPQFKTAMGETPPPKPPRTDVQTEASGEKVCCAT